MSTTSRIGRTLTRSRGVVARPARLAAFWFGLQFVWGAILAVSLQARSVALAPEDGLRAYALIAALGALVGTVAQLSVGPLADRAFARSGHRRGFFLSGVALTIPALVAFFLAPSYVALIAAFFGLQIGMNIAIGPYQAIVPDYVPAARTGTASSWMGIFQPLGNAGGLVVAGFIANQLTVALLLILALGVSCAITLAHARELPSQRNAPAAWSIDRNFRTLVASRAAISMGFYTLLGFLFFFVQQSLGMRGDAIRMQTALLFLTFTIANVVGAVLAARPVDRFDKRLVVCAANGGVALGLLLLAFAPNLTLAFVAAAIAGSAWGAYFIADWSLAWTFLPRSAMASAMGVWNIAATVPQIAAPLVTTPLVEAVNARAAGAGPRVAILAAIVEFTVGALWLFRLPRS